MASCPGLGENAVQMGAGGGDLDAEAVGDVSKADAAGEFDDEAGLGLGQREALLQAAGIEAARMIGIADEDDRGGRMPGESLSRPAKITDSESGLREMLTVSCAPTLDGLSEKISVIALDLLPDNHPGVVLESLFMQIGALRKVLPRVF
jgi:hypothetical protein